MTVIRPLCERCKEPHETGGRFCSERCAKSFSAVRGVVHRKEAVQDLKKQEILNAIKERLGNNRPQCVICKSFVKKTIHGRSILCGKLECRKEHASSTLNRPKALFHAQVRARVEAAKQHKKFYQEHNRWFSDEEEKVPSNY